MQKSCRNSHRKGDDPKFGVSGFRVSGVLQKLWLKGALFLGDQLEGGREITRASRSCSRSPREL